MPLLSCALGLKNPISWLTAKLREMGWDAAKELLRPTSVAVGPCRLHAFEHAANPANPVDKTAKYKYLLGLCPVAIHTILVHMCCRRTAPGQAPHHCAARGRHKPQALHTTRYGCAAVRHIIFQQLRQMGCSHSCCKTSVRMVREPFHWPGPEC